MIWDIILIRLSIEKWRVMIYSKIFTLEFSTIWWDLIKSIIMVLNNSSFIIFKI